MIRYIDTARTISLLAGWPFVAGQTKRLQGWFARGARRHDRREYQESPVLVARVAAGDLPLVEERLPADPAACAPRWRSQHLTANGRQPGKLDIG